jgi:hypothetical protein
VPYPQLFQMFEPVRARLAGAAEAWPWSSARAHLAGRDDGLVGGQPLLDQAPDWSAFLAGGLGEDEREALRAGERTGRPLGSAAFIASLEQSLGRSSRAASPARSRMTRSDRYCVPGLPPGLPPTAMAATARPSTSSSG